MKCNINFNHNIMDYDFCATIHMTSEEYELLNRAYQEFREEEQNDYLGIRAICEWFEEKNDSDMAERFLELMDSLYSDAFNSLATMIVDGYLGEPLEILEDYYPDAGWSLDEESVEDEVNQFLNCFSDDYNDEIEFSMNL